MARDVIGWAAAALGGLGAALYAGDAGACGGFFCNQQPIDQSAERILFEVDDDAVTMTVQIAFSGNAADFAWILPLSEPPEPESLAVFSQNVLNALDRNTAPRFVTGCPYTLVGPPCEQCAQAGPGDNLVNVFLRAEVGAYDVAVVGSEDPDELVRWLRDAGYRITPVMQPYVAQYAADGMKFLALKLREMAGTSDIRPFRFRVPGTAPSIPLRMTALASEPELSIVAFVLASQRFEGKNWANLALSDADVRYDIFNATGSVQTNWDLLVSRAADGAGGQAWVTEYAGPSGGFADQLQTQLDAAAFPLAEDAAAARDLIASLKAHPYVTRLHARLSPEEMVSDPVLGRSPLSEVSRSHQLERVVAGIDQCDDAVNTDSDPCDFAACGPAGLCRPSRIPNFNSPGCACLPGTTARTTLWPNGSARVMCQDARMSFLNPGDREAEGVQALPDPCADYECGQGRCVAMNLTPSCVCDRGFVAVGYLGPSGTRLMRCVEPLEPVPDSFYGESPVALPPGLPGGRTVDVASFPIPRSAELTPEPTPGVASRSGCALTRSPSRTSALWATLALLLGLSRRRLLRAA